MEHEIFLLASKSIDPRSVLKMHCFLRHIFCQIIPFKGGWSTILRRRPWRRTNSVQILGWVQIIIRIKLLQVNTHDRAWRRKKFRNFNLTSVSTVGTWPGSRQEGPTAGIISDRFATEVYTMRTPIVSHSVEWQNRISRWRRSFFRNLFSVGFSGLGRFEWESLKIELKMSTMFCEAWLGIVQIGHFYLVLSS